MRTVSYYIVDVFAERRFAGNQLAVFEDGDQLTSAEMLNITKEIGYAETTF
ncbi:PhzF family phenazine biosynthesis protein [Paenibacillus sp. 481]|uniref:PhzF family phenazine biosynthesis protein n=1 Tax=Paenibacillus sp. 481 TaxID=2835869 RepID=UPI0022B33E63|nr:PhzF family phenazine biosynthesis protein [Paenibacillus sp. 481]